MIKWIRPSGNEIETNNTKASVEYAESHGWKRVKGKPGPKAKK